MLGKQEWKQILGILLKSQLDASGCDDKLTISSVDFLWMVEGM